MSRLYISLIVGIASFACEGGNQFSKSSRSDGTEAAAQSASGSGAVDFVPLAEKAADTRPLEQVLCQDGPQLASSTNQGNYSYHFEALCQGNQPSPFFAKLLESAYKGVNDPVIHNLDVQVSELYATRVLFAYAILSPVTDSSVLIKNRIHDAMVGGISDEWSKLLLTIDSAALFPGNRLIQEVRLTYDLQSMENMGIFDKRSTTFKTYLPLERNRDLTISFENLADGPTRYYQYVHGLNFTIKAQNGSSYIVVVQDMVIKDRIDPAKIIRTLNGLNRSAIKLSHQKLVNASK